MNIAPLPHSIQSWFARHAWQPHPHQLDLFVRKEAPSTLLIAPTGAGKTLSGFLPTLAELAADGPHAGHKGLHTIYVSPLKALAADIKRNLTRPVQEMGLDIRIEDRTGDTTAKMRKTQRVDPPQILLTTPESLTLLMSYPEASKIFGTLERVIIDEIHALAESKRGDQLMLTLSHLRAHAPNMRRVGLSATVDQPTDIAKFLDPAGTDILYAEAGPPPNITMLETATPPPWAGAGGAHAVPDVLDLIKAHKTTLVFHNTRAQAEIFFHALWMANEDGLPIAIHHGSLDKIQRQRVEEAMSQGALRAVVCTGTLDLGIDWGDVDLVIQIGAPKNVKRLVQRIGRANHSYNTPSKAMIVPANRFEIIECVAALTAVKEGRLDGERRAMGPMDVLCQHILAVACSGPFCADQLFDEITQAGPYAQITQTQFDRCLEFCATGGYALRAYDQWQRLMQRDGLWQLRDPRSAARIRMNIGTIQDRDLLKVRLKGVRGGAGLGEIEEGFASTLTAGDTFLMGGKVVRYEGLRELVVEVTHRKGREPKIATFAGTKFATSLELSKGILDLLHQRSPAALPAETQRWLSLQRSLSCMPEYNSILVETFEHRSKPHLVAYGFAGRNAMQTLGLLITKEMEARGLDPLGFVSTDYAVMIWGLRTVDDPAPLFDPDVLMTGFQTWLDGNAVMKRNFRAVAQITGLIERQVAGLRKSGRQTTFSSDILYGMLRKYDPDHLLLEITRQEALHGFIDFDRVHDMIERTGGRVIHRQTERVTPLAAPLLLEAGRIPVDGAARERILVEDAAKLMQKAGLE